MDINEIIYAFDTDKLPLDLTKLSKMLATVKGVRSDCLHGVLLGEKHETREMFYTTCVLMDEIILAICNQIKVLGTL